MTWNPRRRTSRQSCVPQAIGQERSDVFEIQQKNIERLDENSKKLLKDVKKCTEYLAELARSEQKITTNLSSSVLCHYDESLRLMTEEYHSVTKALDQNTNELILISQKGVLEPVKKYNAIFNHLNTALKKRDQLVQECKKCQVRLEKLQEKEKTGPNIAKLLQYKKALEHSQEELAEHDAQLSKEMPRLYESRFQFFHPCVEAFVRGQVEYHGRSAQLFVELAPNIQGMPRDQSQNVAQKMAEIRSLSIVAD